MRVFCLIIGLLFVLSAVHMSGQHEADQNKETSVAQQMIEKGRLRLIESKTSKDSANILTEIAFIYKMQGRQHEARETIEQAKSLAVRADNDTLDLKIIGASASIYGESGDHGHAIEEFRKSLQIAQALKDSVIIRSSFYELALNMVDYGTLSSALDTIQIALGLYENSGEDKKVGLCFNSIAAIYSAMGNAEEALRYRNRAIAKFESVESSRTFPNVLCGKAQHLRALGRSSEAESTLKQALDYARKFQYRPEEGHIFLALGSLSLDQEDYTSSGAYLDSAGVIYTEIGYQNGLPEVYLNQSRLKASQGDYQAALYSAKHGLAAAAESENVKLKANLWEQVYLHQMKLDKPAEALRSRIIFDSLNHELNALYELKQTRDLEARYRNEAQKKELLMKDQLIHTKEAEVREAYFQNRMTLAFTLGLSILSLLTFLWYRQRMRNQKQATRLALNQALIESTDKERERIAQELHDGIGSLLTGTKLGLEHTRDSSSNEKLREKLDQSIDQVQSIAQEVRRVSHAMAPAAIDRLGFEDVLSDLIATYQMTDKADIELSVSADVEQLNKIERLMLYRILQECLNNSFKHAEPTEVNISISVEDSQAELLYHDNGKGFNDEVKGNGIGLEGIDQRIRYLNGKKVIESEKGEGMSLIVSFPLSRR